MKQMLHVFCVALMLSAAALCANENKTTTPHAHHPSYQKPGASIRLGDPISLALPANSNATETLRFSASKKGILRIQAKPGPNISIDDTSEHTFDLGQEPPELTLTINTQEDIMSHIMFHAVIEHNGATRSRVFGIPVRIGDPVIQAKATANQPSVVILKAEETIRHKKKP